MAWLCCSPCSCAASQTQALMALVQFQLGSTLCTEAVGSPCCCPELHAQARLSLSTNTPMGTTTEEHSSQNITHLLGVAFLLLMLPGQFPLCLLPAWFRHDAVQPAQVMQGEDALQPLPDPHQG